MIHIKLPLLRVRWDKRGFVDILIGTVYGVSDYLIHIGMLAH